MEAENPFGSGKIDPNDPEGSAFSMIEGVGDFVVLAIVAGGGLAIGGYVLDRITATAGIDQGGSGISIEGNL